MPRRGVPERTSSVPWRGQRVRPDAASGDPGVLEPSPLQMTRPGDLPRGLPGLASRAELMILSAWVFEWPGDAVVAVQPGGAAVGGWLRSRSRPGHVKSQSPARTGRPV